MHCIALIKIVHNRTGGTATVMGYQATPMVTRSLRHYKNPQQSPRTHLVKLQHCASPNGHVVQCTNKNSSPEDLYNVTLALAAALVQAFEFSLSFFLTSLEKQDEAREAQIITLASVSNNFLLLTSW